jgi:hypothetical protein
MALVDAAEDPFDAFMQRLQDSGPNNWHATGGTDDNNSQPPDRSDDEGEIDRRGTPVNVIDPELDDVRPSLSSRPIAVILWELKRQKNLSPESEAKIDVFAVSSSINVSVILMRLVCYTRKHTQPRSTWQCCLLRPSKTMTC